MCARLSNEQLLCGEHPCQYFCHFRSLFLGHSNPKFVGFPDPGTAGSKRYSTKPAATPPRLACRCFVPHTHVDIQL